MNALSLFINELPLLYPGHAMSLKVVLTPSHCITMQPPVSQSLEYQYCSAASGSRLREPLAEDSCLLLASLCSDRILGPSLGSFAKKKILLRASTQPVH